MRLQKSERKSDAKKIIAYFLVTNGDNDVYESFLVMCVKISCLLDPFFLVDRLAFYVYLGWRSAQRGSKVLYLSIAQYDAVVHGLLNLDRILHR